MVAGATRRVLSGMPNFVKFSVVVTIGFCLLGILFLTTLQLQARIDALESRLQEESGGGKQPAFPLASRGTGPASHGSFEENHVVFYNRVPKSGSTTLMGLVYKLAQRNGFHCLHVNISKNDHYLSPANQYKFVWNVTTWTKHLPGFYHGHVVYIDFPRFGAPHPIFIQLVRDPIERMVSYFYFLRFGDDFRPNLKRSKMGDTMTFDECIEKSHRDCSPRNWWVQIPFFCGMSPQCKVPGSKWALEQAKRNMIEKYFVVGVTEQIPEFVAVLEAALPRYFKGASKQYASGNQSHLRKTKKKIPPKEETIKTIKALKEWQMENELYQLAVSTFADVKKRMIKTVSLSSGEKQFVKKDASFFFEKIVGPNGKEQL